MDADLESELTFKIILFGDLGVGKTGLYRRFAGREFEPKTRDESSVDTISYRSMNVCQETVRVELWDTGGFERYRSWDDYGVYFHEVDGAMILYDIRDHESYLYAVTEHLEELKDQTQFYSPVIMLVGNCCDVKKDERFVSTSEARMFADQNGLLFSEISVKESIGIEKAFYDLAKEISVSRTKLLEQTLIHEVERPSETGWRHKMIRRFSSKQQTLANSSVQRNQEKKSVIPAFTTSQGNPPPTRNNTIADEKEQLEGQVARLSAHVVTLTEKVKTLYEEAGSIEKLAMEKSQLEQEFHEKVTRLENEISDLQQQLSSESWKVSYKELTLLKEELGRGGWGVICIGLFREQKVAVKQMHDAITSQTNLDLLHREINTMAHLRHPNLLQFIGAVFDSPSGNPMIITEIMDMSLRQAYERKLLVPTKTCQSTCVTVMRDVAVGLNYLHSLPDPIIHRDVSSGNVLLESKGDGKWKTKISDFGSANKAKHAVTRAAGALVYSAPECLQRLPVNVTIGIGSDKKTSSQTTKMDIYSYGVLLCEVLNCRFPDTDNFPEMLQLVRSRSVSLYDLVFSCLSESPDSRPSMKHVIEQIDLLSNC